MNKITPWFVDICNIIVASKFPPKASKLYKEKIENDAKYYIWDDPYIWRLYSDQVIRRCIPDPKVQSVLHFCHSTSGGSHYGSTRIARNVLEYGFGVPKDLISDQGSHFCNRAMSSLLKKYGVEHRIATTYHTQTNGQVEVFNKEIKKILQKIANPSRKD
ncbi:Pro-Pol polyprotein, partial [Mucuna pruriens]